MKFRFLKKDISLPLLSEFRRFFIAFGLAWVCTILVNDIPFVINFIKQTTIDDALRSILVIFTEKALNILNFETYSEVNYLRILGNPGVRFEYGCLGIRNITLFSFFILFQYGKLYHKLWYILIGISILILTNALRAVTISIGQHINNEHTTIIHDIATPVIMLPVILILWLIWISSFGRSIK